MLPAASGVEINGEIGSRECRHPFEKGGHRRPLGPSTTRLLVVAAATSIRLNSPVGVRERWEVDVDTAADILFTVFHCSMYCLQCGV